VKGLVVFSFALRGENREPNPCNVRLAAAVEHIIRHENDRVLVVAQWEVARALPGWICVTQVVEPYTDGSYLDSEGVWTKAAEAFEAAGVEVVIPVAQPFLHLTKIKQLVRQSGFKLDKRHIGWIGFDKQSLQWWTRGPVRTLVYALLQSVTGYRD
jgi:hypothetical protein